MRYLVPAVSLLALATPAAFVSLSVFLLGIPIGEGKALLKMIEPRSIGVLLTGM